MPEVFATDLIDAIEHLFETRKSLSSRDRKALKEWRDAINELIDKLNSLTNKKIYTRQ